MIRKVLASCLLAFVWLTTSMIVHAKTDPLVIVRTTATELTFRLIEDKALIEQQSHYLEQLIDDHLSPVVDYRHMSRQALGKYWRRASESQKREFQAAFKRKLIRSYAHAFKAFQGQDIHFGPALFHDENTDHALIRSYLQDTSGEKVHLDYRMHHQNGWQVYDIVIEGISLTTTFKEQIQNLIKQNGLSRALSKLTKQFPDDRPTIVLGADNWAPYVSDSLPDKGLAAAIVSTAFEQLGYKVEIHFAPWKKLLEGTGKGTLDGLLATWPNQKSPDFVLSDAYLKSELRFIKRSNDPFTYQNPEQLAQFLQNKSYRLGIFADYNYQDYIDHIDGKFQVERLDYCSQLFREVASNNIDLALVDRWIADNELASKENVAEYLSVVPTGIAETTIHLALTNQQPTDQNSRFLLEGFNKILARLQHSGEYQNLLTRHQYPQ